LVEVAEIIVEDPLQMVAVPEVTGLPGVVQLAGGVIEKVPGHGLFGVGHVSNQI